MAITPDDFSKPSTITIHKIFNIVLSPPPQYQPIKNLLTVDKQ
jgi:hypothetical protein